MREAWTSWAGGECPVSPEMLVEIRCRDGSTGIERANHWNWNSEFAPIVAYRLAQEDPSDDR